MNAAGNMGMPNISSQERCESFILFYAETSLSNGIRAFFYFIALAYCFIGLSSITARFFQSMENIVKHTRKIVEINPSTGTELIKYEKVWNYTIADIALLALGTSFPQISLATIDAIQNIGQLNAGGTCRDCDIPVVPFAKRRGVGLVLTKWSTLVAVGLSILSNVAMVAWCNCKLYWAYRNMGHYTWVQYSFCLGPGTLVGSAAFDLFPIHAICVVVPKSGTLKKISDLGVWLVELLWSFWAYVWLYIILEVWTPKMITLSEALLTVLQYGLLLVHAYAQDKRWPYLSIPLGRSERPEEWVPENKTRSSDDCGEILPISEGQNGNAVDRFSIHSCPLYKSVPDNDMEKSVSMLYHNKIVVNKKNVLSVWRQQFLDALMLASPESKKTDTFFLLMTIILWRLIVMPWRLLFAFVPPYQVAHGWIAFIGSLVFISGIAYVVTKLTEVISCVAGINPYVIALTALASGTSWPDLVASKIAAERQITADSAIANITCSNSVNIYIGIGIPWLIDTTYKFFVYREPLYFRNAGGLSFSLLVFFATSAGCIAVLVLRRLILGAELGGPRLWTWLTSGYLMFLWVVFVVLSSLKVSGKF